MISEELKTYRFEKAVHWLAGRVQQFECGGDGVEDSLQTPAQRQLSDLLCSGVQDMGAVPDIDPVGDLYWVRAESFELIRLIGNSCYRVGELAFNDGHLQPADLVVGLKKIWLRVTAENKPPVVLRFSKDDLRCLSVIEHERKALAICGDGADGIWLISGGDDAPATVNHFDAQGFLRCQIALPDALAQTDMVINHSCTALVILDSQPRVDPCEHAIAWRLWRVHICSEQVQTLHTQPAKGLVCGADNPDFQPDFLGVNRAGDIQLLAGPSGELWTLSTCGATDVAAVIVQLPNTVPSSRLPVSAMVVADKFVLSTNNGIAQLHLSCTPQMSGPVPTLITPVLVSPEGVSSGWMRADMDMLLDPAAMVEVSVAATRDKTLIARARELKSDPELEALLPWREQQTKIYKGDVGPPGTSLRFPLHEIEDTHLWLRIKLFPPKGGVLSSLRQLTVIYPNISLARFLPEVYQQDNIAAKTLRRFLVMLESVFGDLTRQLTQLPRNINPATAPKNWIAFLLRWLGLPEANELRIQSQRNLLQHAPELLRNRGTLRALESLLELLLSELPLSEWLVVRDFSILDKGAAAAPWVLPRTKEGRQQAPNVLPRLGQGTRVMSLPRSGFRLATRACLGKHTLGYERPNPLTLFAARSNEIEIRVAVASDEREKTAALLARYLPFFIPAQCRFQVHFVAPHQLRRKRILDEALHLAAPLKPRLGNNATLGRLALPDTQQARRGIIVSQSHLHAGLYF